MTGFAVYYTIDQGTVVPFIKSTSTFQNFQKTGGSNKTYDELLNVNYEGHALSSVTLKSTLVNKPVNEGGDFYAAGSSFYMYERKVSVNTSDESSWKESPPHIIVKGKYNGSANETFYKIDLIRTVEVGGAAINQFYNILRNFCYSFTINQIVDYGYETLAEAMANPAGNNLAGSSDTQGFTNLSDGLGRIFVEYTDMTLVTNDDVTLRYKYIPDIRDDNVDNSKILINGIYDDDDNPIGPVFDSYTIGSDDSEGWRTVTFEVNDVSGEVKHQDIVLIITDNSNLNRTIKYTLRNYFPMTLECAPKKVTSSSVQEIRVDIKVPDDLTENLFPLSFDIEDTQLSLSPNSVKNQLPVTVSKSIIPGKESVQTFHYTKKVTWDEYLSYTKSGGQTIIPTYFKTNKSNSASEVHAYNYYFRERPTNKRTARDNFENEQSREIIIPAENLRMSRITYNNSEINYAQNYTVYIYTSNPGKDNNATALTSFSDISRTNNNNRVYYNDNNITLNGVSRDDTIYLRISYTYEDWWSGMKTTIYYVGEVNVGDACDRQTNIDMKQQQ